MPVNAAHFTCSRVIRGAPVMRAMISNTTDATSNRNDRNVIGPASRVPYRATMNPVLHKSTKTTGAALAKPAGETRNGRAAFAARPSVLRDGDA